MDIEKYTVEGRNATLYMADSKDSPLVVLNNYSEDGGPVMKTLKETLYLDFSLLCVGNLNWNHDMTLWPCPPLSPKDSPCTGGADDSLQLLVSEIIPKAKELARGVFHPISVSQTIRSRVFSLCMPAITVMYLIVWQVYPAPCGFPILRSMFFIIP